MVYVIANLQFSILVVKILFYNLLANRKIIK